MNGITRVMISLVLLGACAVAMRWSLVKADTPEARTKIHTAKISVKDTKEINFNLLTPLFLENGVTIRQGSIDSIQANLNASETHKIILNRVMIDGILNVTSSFDQLWKTNYFAQSPQVKASSELLLPAQKALSIDAQLFDNPLDADFRGLQIKEFVVNQNFRDYLLNKVQFVASDTDFTGSYKLQSDGQTASLGIPKGAKGNLTYKTNQTAVTLKISPEAMVILAIHYMDNNNPLVSIKERVIATKEVLTGQNDIPILYFANSQGELTDPVSNSKFSQKIMKIRIVLGKKGTLKILREEP
jgi:hypothetical protein